MILTTEQEMAMRLKPEDIIDNFKNSTERLIVLWSIKTIY